MCLLAWTSENAGIHVFLFDLNQWYKEQMPNVCNWQDLPTYLAVFPLAASQSGVGLDVWMDQNTVSPFNSIQRPEEHFYPSSLSFGKF